MVSDLYIVNCPDSSYSSFLSGSIPFCRFFQNLAQSIAEFTVFTVTFILLIEFYRKREVNDTIMKDPFINRKYVIMALIVLASLGLIIRLFHYSGC